MEFTSQICTTREQSARLLALGIKKETADMYYPNGIQDSEHIIRAIYPAFWESDQKIDAFIRGRVTPAWSLHRLIEMMPQWIYAVDGSLKLTIDQGKLVYYQRISDDAQIFVFGHTSLYDSIIDTIEKLIKEGYFITEYLEDK